MREDAVCGILSELGKLNWDKFGGFFFERKRKVGRERGKGVYSGWR